MDFVAMGLMFTLGLFAGMLVFYEIGRAIGTRSLRRDPEGFSKGTGAAEGAVFALLGLLIALTFSGAASRFQERRQLVADEANAIGTAYLRIGMLPKDAQPGLRGLMRDYLDLRLATYAGAGNTEATIARLRETETAQARIWTRSVAAVQRPDTMPQAAIVLLPAMNEMIDITTTRTMATKNHPPLVVYLLLGSLSLLGALMVGYSTAPNARRNWFHNITFTLILSLTVYVIIDLEFPRIGLIRVDTADQVLVDLRESME
jgi:hypothetical protein